VSRSFLKSSSTILLVVYYLNTVNLVPPIKISLK